MAIDGLFLIFFLTIFKKLQLPSILILITGYKLLHVSAKDQPPPLQKEDEVKLSQFETEILPEGFRIGVGYYKSLASQSGQVSKSS